jgi:4-hydroxybenzoate polyprenyltransferase
MDGVVLAVDLDGTLLRSDMLFESFWAAVRQDWRNPILPILGFGGGRAGLKRYLAKVADIDCANLPYNAAVIAYIESWRAAGGRTALITASDQAVADRIASHLGLFDEVHGSDGQINLKGEKKAAFLKERFGETGFAYIGDASADLPVWHGARKVITVDAGRGLQRQVEMLGRQTEHLSTTSPSMSAYVKMLRPHQWFKNMLVFIPVLAGHQFSLAILSRALLAFVAFNLVASSVYVLNDLLDLSSDRAHPRKRNRPFASGDVSLAFGTLAAPLLLLLGATVATYLGTRFAAVMLAYYLTTTAYSFDLKRRPIIDICVLTLLYTVRIIAGGAATGIVLSVWLLAFSIFFFFSLAAVKRQAELVDLSGRGGLVTSGRGYHVDDLPQISMMATASGYVSVLVMALYVNSSSVAQLYAYPTALWGVCLVLLYWISRMVMVTHRGQMHDDPLVYVAKDRTSQFCVLAIVALGLAGVLL